MSFYATCQGEIKYKDRQSFEKAVGMLKADGWINDDNMFIDEAGCVIADNGGVLDCDDDSLVIRIPYFCHRNLTRTFDELFRGGSGQVTWTSTDGCFEGGVFCGVGNEINDDLLTWAKKNGWTDDEIPDSDCEGEEWIEFMSEVESAYHDEHS